MPRAPLGRGQEKPTTNTKTGPKFIFCLKAVEAKVQVGTGEAVTTIL
jgi:hypothetical protein